MGHTTWRKGIEAGEETNKLLDDVQAERGQVGAIGSRGCLRELEVREDPSI